MNRFKSLIKSNFNRTHRSYATLLSSSAPALATTILECHHRWSRYSFSSSSNQPPIIPTPSFIRLSQRQQQQQNATFSRLRHLHVSSQFHSRSLFASDPGKRHFTSSSATSSSSIPPPVIPPTGAEEPVFSFISYINPVATIESILIQVHDLPRILPFLFSETTEFLPWWGVIALATFAFRFCTTLPLAIQSRARMQRYQRISPVIQAWESTIAQKVAKEMSVNENVARMQPLYLKQAKEKRKQLLKDFSCQRYKTFLLPLVQIPLFVSISLAIRRLAGFPIPFFDTTNAEGHVEPVTGMKEEGILWFEDLSLADPTLITPLMIGILHIVNVQMNPSLNQSMWTRFAARFLQALGLLTIPIASKVPMALSIYWLCSALFSLIQNVILNALYFSKKKV